MDSSSLEALSKKELIDHIMALKNENMLLRKQFFGYKSKIKPKKPQEEFDFTDVTYRHVLLQICYLGWDHDGFTIQDNTVNTIEFYLFEALRKTCLIECREKSNYHRCGRTDKGVSAFCQVISIDLRSKQNGIEHCDDVDEFDYCKLLNSVLPKSIRCISWIPVNDGFSARFNCQMRTYKYFFNKADMDIDLMNEAVQCLIGTHDFRNFCKMDVSNGIVEFTRTIVDARIEKCFNDDGISKVDGFAFLWHQIRCIMAILILVGQRLEKPDIIKNLLQIDENPRKPIYNLALNIPLNLFEVKFDIDKMWIVSPDDLKCTIKHYRETWFTYASKSTMLRLILQKLEQLAYDNDINYDILNNYMFTGIHSKVYQPLLQRRKCESLDYRLALYKHKKLMKDNIDKDKANEITKTD